MKRLWLGLMATAVAGALGCPAPSGEEPGGEEGGPLSPIPEPPTLKAAVAQATGRTGIHLRLSASGADPNGDVTTMYVRLMDAAGNPYPHFDADWDGHPDSAETELPLDTSVEGKTQFAATLTFPGLMVAPPKVFKVAMALVDREGMRSGELTADVTFQPVKALGESCDKNYIEDRCEDGLGCWGEPTICHPGVAPVVDRSAFYKSPYGPRILVEGTDPDDDVAAMTVYFFDQNHQPVKLDLDNDGVPDSAQFRVDARDASSGGKYFVSLQTNPNFENFVSRVAVELEDASQRKGPQQALALTFAPPRTHGQSCDPRGFDACITDYTCFPGMVGAANSCISSAFARTKKCEAAPVLKPSEGVVSAKLTAQGASLWENPLGCASNDPRNRPEAVVRLSLTQPASQLNITTARPGTTVDTIVTLIAGCTDAAMSKPLACNDDGVKTTASQLNLQNVAAGEYVLVIDSWNPAGGQIEVFVEAQ